MPEVTFIRGQSLHWSPQQQIITYCADTSTSNLWGLLHEAGHAELGHTSYDSDMELLQLEAAAWDKAEEIATRVDKIIDQEHIQDCLDTYRDWLHQRSTCPRCGIVSFQQSISAYQCYNCHKAWSVTASRFCRPYRLGSENTKNRPKETSQTVFR